MTSGEEWSNVVGVSAPPEEKSSGRGKFLRRTGLRGRGDAPPAGSDRSDRSRPAGPESTPTHGLGRLLGGTAAIDIAGPQTGADPALPVADPAPKDHPAPHRRRPAPDRSAVGTWQDENDVSRGTRLLGAVPGPEDHAPADPRKDLPPTGSAGRSGRERAVPPGEERQTHALGQGRRPPTGPSERGPRRRGAREDDPRERPRPVPDPPETLPGQDLAEDFPAPQNSRAPQASRALHSSRAPQDFPGHELAGAFPAPQTGRTGRSRSGPPTTPPARSTSRAGRDLPAAIGVGVLLVGLIVGSLIIRKEAFVGVAAAAAVLGVWELAGAFRTKGIEVSFVPLGLGSLGMLISAYIAGEEGLLVAFALTAFGVLLWRLSEGAQDAVQDVTCGVFAAAYVPFLAGFAVLMLAEPDGVSRVILFILVTSSSDIGGYAAGVLFGRHPMAPTISPKKSWEGFAGSATACVVTGAVGVSTLLEGPVWAGALLGAATVVSATVGDFSESLIKRDLGIKDMGTLLPGHGGLMDRLDSLLLTAPVAYVLLALLVP
ncbi:MAG: phosphatidate cytidylyltransferase [Actinomycetota bacterium]|nr:phosphatidate cytidylyltransferase [Actinomycetota bacterium]